MPRYRVTVLAHRAQRAVAPAARWADRQGHSLGRHRSSNRGSGVVETVVVRAITAQSACDTVLGALHADVEPGVELGVDRVSVERLRFGRLAVREITDLR